MTAKKLGLTLPYRSRDLDRGVWEVRCFLRGWQPHTIPERPVRLSLLCESQTGYRNLSQLITGYKLQQKSKGEGIAPLPHD